MCDCVCVCDCVRVQASLGVEGDVSYTCETAGHFFLYQVMSRWERYVAKVKPLAEMVSEGVTGDVYCHISVNCCKFYLFYRNMHVYIHIMLLLRQLYV